MKPEKIFTGETKMRTNMCAALSIADIGREVAICGWVQKIRNLGGVLFLDLRDRSGLLQLVFAEGSVSYEKALGARLEFVASARGVVRARDAGAVNPALPTGEIEVFVNDFSILNGSKTPPFHISDEAQVKEELRLKYRYLDLRRPSLQTNIALRHRVSKLARDYYDENGFLEIETPILTKSTPEGARDYLVPSRVHKGMFYALPQSPQQYKQLLMLSGFDRYFQIAKCFRDEDLRADRQPEFSQIDIEMSFVDEDDVISVNEGFMRLIFKEILNIDLPLPLPRLTYEKAMARYGSDKPDTRFELFIRDLSETVAHSPFKVFSDAVAGGGSVRGITVPGGDAFSRRELDSLTEHARLFKAKGMAWARVGEDGVKSSFSKFVSDEEMAAIIAAAGAGAGDCVLIVADKDDIVLNALGNLRLEVAKRLGLCDDKKHEVLWITDFPLFEFSEEEERLVAKHHPFTSPKDEDLHLLESAPEKVRAKAYDLVLNGVELGGGSIRIHVSGLQSRMFKALGFSEDEAYARFGHLLEAFAYGAPPHGGMAYGLDRLVMLLAGTNSIRDVMAFPKVQSAGELMTGAPGEVDKAQLDELGLILKNSQKV